jgi:cysteine desulfurase
MMKPIYLDYNATTPVHPEVVAAMRPYLEEHFGNPSSAHWYGQQTRKGLDKARQRVAAFLGCSPEEVVFTSGGSEANNYAIMGAARARRDQGNHIITSAVEHPAVTRVLEHLAGDGFEFTCVPVDEHGLVSPADVEAAVTPRTILITIMHANNEVGTIMPIADIARLARDRGILMHTDAAQSVGKIPTPVDELGVDLLSMAGHKLYAPKGVGALYIKSGVELEKLIHGADHERNRRAGTENVLEIAGLGRACKIAARDLEENMVRMKTLRDRLHDGLEKRIPGWKLNGHPELRLPNTLSISFPRIEANTLLAEVAEIAASAGAACHSGSIAISPVLKAMGVPGEYAMGTVRLSVGRMTTQGEIDRTIDVMSGVVREMEKRSDTDWRFEE